WRNHIALKRCPELLGQFSLLAKDVNDNAGRLDERVAQTFFASRLAPTGLRSWDLSGRIKASQPSSRNRKCL
ncbi:hypothetical protein, partial [Pseudomonas sp. C2B4]|uniref:hypothetical protein n=1 Tax=Pseudomonas sp. C2B4 TaxID=2735270 RepID=UPI001C498EFA